MKNNILILVAVRLKSTRLRKKAMKNLFGIPLILRLNQRLNKVKTPSKIIWCTSTNIEDDPIESLAKKNNIECFRGSELDVMDRFIKVGNRENASLIVRVTGDNPLTDPFMIDYMLEKHIVNNAEYTYNEDLPIGTRSEVMSLSMLKKCHSQLIDPNQSEYMTWMVNRPKYFKTQKISSPIESVRFPEVCLTVDTREQYKVMKKIYDNFKGEPPTLDKILEWIFKNKINTISKSHKPVIEKKDIEYRLLID